MKAPQSGRLWWLGIAALELVTRCRESVVLDCLFWSTECGYQQGGVACFAVDGLRWVRFWGVCV